MIYYLIFYDEYHNELHKIDISYIRENLIDLYEYLENDNTFDTYINYLQKLKNNILNNNYYLDYDKLDDLIYKKQYYELIKFFREEIIKLNNICDIKNLNNYNMKEEDKIKINKINQLLFNFEQYKSNKNYFMIVIL